ncbi:Hypothetical predicted protein [Marmota monax]|uniref:Uncharacterized protein n=1 Tax=Marmota monax TaxID=9995 RepID=A0A5E4CV31_MARMO|nr:hypothetical protein GHT09_013233 [Marmota monax]VTJ85633.1 Hypothetical predicted protein [Marmota monax]
MADSLLDVSTEGGQESRHHCLKKKARLGPWITEVEPVGILRSRQAHSTASRNTLVLQVKCGPEEAEVFPRNSRTP